MCLRSVVQGGPSTIDSFRVGNGKTKNINSSLCTLYLKLFATVQSLKDYIFFNNEIVLQMIILPLLGLKAILSIG